MSIHPRNHQGMEVENPGKIHIANHDVSVASITGMACILVLAGLLVAGLWPFHSPRNHVSWLGNSNGLHVGPHGTILSSVNFKGPKDPAGSACSLEIWITPDFTSIGGTILSFYAPGTVRRFSLQQSITDLLIRSDNRERWFQIKTRRLYAGDIFRRGKPLFITITTNGGDISVYVDGALVESGPISLLSAKDVDGELVLATGPTNDDSWSGRIRGLGIYDQALSAAAVSRHYKTWVKGGHPEVSADEHAMALYLFNEGAGSVIHNQVPSGPDLIVPNRYKIVDQVFLKPFWESYQPSWSYWEDVLINIVGFAPFGFLCCAFLSLTGRTRRPGLTAILMGFAVSLIIESTQVFLPTRDSDSTDVITNTLGTVCGVGLFRLNIWRFFWREPLQSSSFPEERANGRLR
jgi:VanZ family protein